jgi:S1-C subfamily serine protease
MRTWVCILLVAMLGTAVAQAILPREVRNRILQAVVELRPFDASLGQPAGVSGSGTIISADGYVLTNFHVVGDVDTGRAHEWHGVYVTDPTAPDLEPRFAYWARFVVGDAHHDLALVQIVEDADEQPLPVGFVFPSMPVGDSNTLIPGDPITVVGYPGISGATITFTSGIVSGFLGEDLSAGGKQWIKTDAKLARGNSGGAAFDENGVLVGIPTLRLQTQDGAYIEQQDYLRPVALAWPLITAHVANPNRIGGVGSQVAGLAPDAAAVLAPRPPPLPTPAAPVPPAGNPLAPPTTAAAVVERGALQPGDATLTAGEYVDTLLIDASAGATVEVTLTSTAFDAYLIVVAPDGAVVMEIDDAPGRGSDAAGTFVAQVGGTYTVLATSYGPGETGAYELRVTGATTTGAPAAAATAPGTADALLQARDRLDTGDVVLDSGEYADLYAVELVAGVPVWFELTSGDFDAYLVVLGPSDDVVLEVDDSVGWGLDVAAGFEPTVSGTYLVAVTSAFPGETGAYDLWVRAGLAPGTPATVAGGAAGVTGTGSGLMGALVLGGPVSAELAAGGQRVAFHTYVVDVPQGTARLTVEMTADVDLDLFLKFGSEIVALGDAGDWHYRDIDPAPAATFTIPAPAPGRWYVDVVWIGGGDGAARYTLRAH